MSNVAATIITIGDELLIGQVIDTNSAWIARHLNELGIDVLRRVAVGDDREAIWQALDEAIITPGVVIITGGLGPTADDITKPLLCDYFEGKLVIDERVLEHVKSLFAKRNRPFLERNMKQAEVPDNCTVLFNRMGTAPGMWFEEEDQVVISLPGVPFEMVWIMENEALPRLKQKFFSDAIIHRSVITAGEGESFIAVKIEDIEESLPRHIRLAYLPGAGMVKLRLTGRAADAVQLTKELETYQQQLAERLGPIVVALEDIPLEEILGRWFKANKKTIGLAESCTGGFLAHHLTQVPGSSEYFTGCIVCYANSVKEQVLGVKKETIEQYGAISEQAAIEMVQGALRVLGTDYAFAVTGLMSPGGESYKTEVGTVWMAVADNDSVKTRKFWFPYDRARNKEMSVSMGMLMVWKFVTGPRGEVKSEK